MESFAAGLGSLQLEYDANKNPAIFQQLCELQLDKVITQASSVDIEIITATAGCAYRSLAKIKKVSQSRLYQHQSSCSSLLTKRVT